jgi:RNA polymerase sigma factor (TIGR02999 family)
MTVSGDVTQALGELDGRGGEAAEKLLPLVYDDLRRLADRYFRDEPADLTLQPTALVHEVYMRLIGSSTPVEFKSRAQFFAVATQAMRHLLIDHARRRRAARRGGGRPRLSLEDVSEPAKDRDEYLVALDDALTDLDAVDRQLSRIIELRFFGGLTVEETAHVVGVSPITVKRRWRLAKAWLHRQIVQGL